MGNTMQDEVFMKKAIELSKLAVEHVSCAVAQWSG